MLINKVALKLCVRYNKDRHKVRPEVFDGEHLCFNLFHQHCERYGYDFLEELGSRLQRQHVQQQHQDGIDTRNPGPESGIRVRMMVTAPEGCGPDSVHGPQP